MKRILFLFALLVAVSTTAKAETNTTLEATASNNNFVRGYGNSFIFVEGGIEFSVFPDGQFDFYMPNYGPNVNVGINRPGFALSFNTGFNYNPFVQYDSFGAIVQIENTPVFYDFYGRVNQIGNIFINYNGFGRVNRIGGLNIFYRNNVFWRYEGFINIYNRAYIWRPWHRFYALPPANFCVLNSYPYRQFYTPVRHIWYRPYRNNVRHFNINGRRDYAHVGRRNATRHSNRYAQTPRNRSERATQRSVQRRYASINRTRNTNINNGRTRSTRNTEISHAPNRTRVSNNAVRTRSNARPAAKRSEQSATRASSTRQNVNRTRSNVSKNVKKTRTASVRKPKAINSRQNNRLSSPNVRKQGVVQNKRMSSSVTERSNKSRSNNRSSSRSNSRRSRL
jgi:hypothetical protein